MNGYPRSARLAVAASCVACLAGCLTACTGSSSSGPAGGSPVGSGPTATGGPAPASGSPAASSAHGSPLASPARSGNSTQTSKPTSTALSTVPTLPVTTLPAKPLISPAPFGTGVQVRIESVTHGKDTDTGRGAIRGRPTVVFHLELTNGSTKKVDLYNVQVNATYGDSDTPAIQADNTSTPFTGSVAPGATARGVYAFAVPSSGQGHVGVTVNYQQGVPTVLLRGSAR